MFRKKKKEIQYPLIDDTRVLVHDFNRRFPYENYRAVDYQKDISFDDKIMIPMLDKFLKILLDGDGIDDGNENMLDNPITAGFLKAVSNLDEQQINHNDVIRRLIARRQSDRIDIQRIRDHRIQELKRLESEYDIICKKINTLEERK